MPSEENMVYSEMETDENGSIEAIRRQEFTLFALISEILGNLTGNKINLLLDEDIKSLIIYHNDNGFTDKDKKAIRKKYCSNKNGAGINGIGIRVAFDRFSDNERKTVIRSKNETSSQKISFLMDKRLTSWRVTEWFDFSDEDHSIFTKYSESEKSGTLIVIPLNEEYFEELTNNNNNNNNDNKLKSLCKKVFNTVIYKNEIDFTCNNEKLTANVPICHNSVLLNCSWCHYGTNKSNGTRFIKINNYDILPEIYKSKLFEYMADDGEQLKKQTKNVFTESDYQVMENFTVKISNNNNEIFQNIIDEYKLKINELKGVHICLDDKYILEKPIIRNSGYKQSFPSDWNPIIEITPSKNTTIFDLTSNKSTTRETNSDGKKFLKSIWAITRKIFPPPQKPTEATTSVDLETPVTPITTLLAAPASVVAASASVAAPASVAAASASVAAPASVVAAPVPVAVVSEASAPASVAAPAVSAPVAAASPSGPLTPSINSLQEDSSEENSSSESDASNAIENKPRKAFSDIIKRKALENCESKCSLLKIPLQTYKGVVDYEFDHKDNDRSNNSLENCNPLSRLAHNIKTHNPEYYYELENDLDKNHEFRKNYILSLASSFFEDNDVNQNSKNDFKLRFMELR